MEGNVCKICYITTMSPKNKKNISCGHEICIKCYKQLIKKECPFCRYIFGTNKDIEKGESILNSIYINYYFINESPPMIINNNLENILETDIIMNNYIDVNYYENKFIKNSRVGRRISRRYRKKYKKKNNIF